MTNARELARRLLDLLRREQSAMSDFLVALAAFDERRAWADLGFTSLFHFLHRELGMSKGAAHYRKTAAELIQRVPEIVEPLRDGRICITSIIELAKVVTPENRHEVLPRFFNCSRQEAKAVSAELCPAEAAPHRTVVTTMAFAMPARVEVVPASAEAVQLVELHPVDGPPPCRQGHAPVESRTQVASVAVRPVAPRTVAEPLTADLRRLHVTVSKRFMEKLEAARDALSHSHPGAGAEAIIEAGLDLLIERAAKRKGCATPKACTRPKECARPKAERVEPKDQLHGQGRGRSEQPRQQAKKPRFIPAAVKREVWLRDGARCQFRLENGELCGATHRLQFDHIRPMALGGKSTVSNIRLACAPHNLLAARRIFGDALMDRYALARTAGALAEAR